MTQERHIHIHLHLDGLLPDEQTPAQPKVEAKVPQQKRTAGPKREPAASVVREWARTQGMEVPKSGKPRRELVEAYKAAN